MIYRRLTKRLLDILISSISIIILCIPMAVIAILIKVDSKGPAIFKQKRLGLGGREFNIYKFRTMYTEAPKDMPTHLLSSPDQWITRVGRFLRQSSLDELPQLFCIFMSKMSVVGPRPALWNQYDLIAEREKYGANDVKPGLTGWAQVNGRDELEISVKARLDGEYAKKLNQGGFQAFAMDCQCIWRTVISVIKRDGIVEGGTGTVQRGNDNFSKIGQKVIHK